MDEIDCVSEERKQELQEIFKIEIEELQAKILNREEFIEKIKLKNITFMDFCYLISTYIGKVKVIEENPLRKLAELNIDDQFFETQPNYDIKFETKNNSIPKIKNLKKIKKYENMNKQQNHSRRI